MADPKQVVVKVNKTKTGAEAVVPAGTKIYQKESTVDTSNMRRSDKMDNEGNLHITYTKEN